MPGHNSNIWLNWIGWLAVALTLLGVILHAIARMIFKGRKHS